MFVLRLLSSVRHCRAAAFVTLRSADAIKLADWMQISPGSCCLLSDDITQVSSTVERRACGRVTEQQRVVLPVGHSHDDVLHAVLRRLVDDGLQGGDQRLAALQAEALLCRPLLLQELLKPEHRQTRRLFPTQTADSLIAAAPCFPTTPCCSGRFHSRHPIDGTSVRIKLVMTETPEH